MENGKVIVLDGNISINDVVNAARYKYKVEISANRETLTKHYRKKVDKILSEDKAVYGITTGVGPFWQTKISGEEAVKLQENLIMSHASNVGTPFDEETVRAFMFVLLNNISKGHTCVRPETIETIKDMLNNDVTPYIPHKGSVGYLQPSAHMALVLYGKGKAYHKGKLMTGKEAMDEAGVKMIELNPKEGLSLMNNSCFMTGLGSLAVYDSLNLLKVCDISGALSFEALKGNKIHFDDLLCSVRDYEGIRKTSRNFRRLLENSEIMDKYKDYRIQDALSIRMMPQVHGSCKDTVKFVEKTINTELNSISDNPLFFEKENVDYIVHGGNCDGTPVAMALDVLAIAVAKAANMSERRIYRLTDTKLGELPSFLISKGGLNSGYMIPQYTAAALVAENKLLANPVSSDSIPTSAGQEDFISLGCIAAKKAWELVKNFKEILSIELLMGSQGVDFLNPLKLGKGTEAAYEIIRQEIPFWEEDRVMYEDIEKVSKIISSEKLVSNVERNIGELEL